MLEVNSKRSCLTFKGFIFLSVSILANLFFLQSFGQKNKWIAPSESNTVKNPFAGKGQVSATKAIYISNCGPCHGDKGKGNGPAAPGLNPKPADHASMAVQSESDGSLFWKVTNGRNPMPAYKKVFTDQQRWELINFIRTLKH